MAQTLNLVDFSIFLHGALIVANVMNLVQLSQVYHTERPPLFAIFRHEVERCAVRLQQLMRLV